ncbi:RagB/SusD family nutrient uptake outer membrane protein [Chitinophaga sp. 22620]|uniref:RagB/SusD family nutrient uptake outer membrane protein n=1 Tax=Chitinophaga sp. 22620 TaxID=3453952 RepID=UPI003F8523F8
MRTFKLQYIRNLAIAGLSAVVALAGCTKDFERINTNPYGVSEDDLKTDFRLIGEPFKQIQNSIYGNSPGWVMQVQQNLEGDIWSGYMGVPGPFGNGGNNNSTYNLIDGWTVVMWGCAYGNYPDAPNLSVMPVARRIEQLAGEEFKDFKAWMQILKVLVMQRVSDVYGPIIYTKYGVINPDKSIDYDSQKDAYYAFFKDLNDAIAVLTPLRTSTLKPFEKFDLTYDGSHGAWLKFANSLRLRLAIRIAKVDPVKAKAEGEAALSNPGGLLTTVADIAAVNIAPTPNPYNTYTSGYNDIRMGAPMESILTGYNDPRISKYFETSSAVPGVFKGIRTGIALPDKIYADYSKLAPMPSKMQLMTAAEVWFLKAEAALRGWSEAGTAKDNYEAGVRASFEQYELSSRADAYLANNTAKAAPYVDTKNAVNNVNAGNPTLSTVTIRWEEGDAFERKLERIITQKWIAVFPDGQEAWSEFRRTGYPKLFKVVVNNSGGKIPTDLYIRRVNFAFTEYASNPLGVQRAVTLLGGPDNGGTRLWWDKP